MPEIELVGGITLGIAILGAVLGIMNTWWNYERDRVKLKVTPRIAYSANFLEGPRIGIRIINLSAFAVNISEVGFTTKGRKGRNVLVVPLFLDGAGLPRHVEPRRSINVYGYATPDELAKIRKGACAYAETDCLERKTGTSPALKTVIRIKRVPKPTFSVPSNGVVHVETYDS